MLSALPVLLALSLSTSCPESVKTPSSGSATATGADRAVARERLLALLAGTRGANELPTSPRYLAVERGRHDPVVVIVGWMMPGASRDDERRVEAAACTLGERDGWLEARLVATGKADRVELWFERRDGVLWLGVEIQGRGRVSAKELELAVLEAVGVLAAHATRESQGDQPVRVEADELSPARVGRAVARWLAPNARGVVELHAKDAPQATGPRPPRRHVVKEGDTLTHIARRHGLDLEALVKMNGVDPDKPIHPGDELRLSEKGARRPKLYVVKAGDTLAKVARRFGVSKKALLEVNRLSAGPIKKGQKLVLPR